MSQDELSIRDEVSLDIQPANELEVRRWEVDGIAFVEIRAFGESADHLNKALDDLASMREQAPNAE